MNVFILFCQVNCKNIISVCPLLNTCHRLRVLQNLSTYGCVFRTPETLHSTKRNLGFRISNIKNSLLYKDYIMPRRRTQVKPPPHHRTLATFSLALRRIRARATIRNSYHSATGPAPYAFVPAYRCYSTPSTSTRPGYHMADV